jgi:CO/xanthine dehydrogenase FAD-binding subunit
MAALELIAPATEEEVLEELARGPAGSTSVLAGGTDLLSDLDERRVAPRRLLSLRRLPWRTHRWEGGGLRVGATEPLRALESDRELARRLPALAQAVAAVGSPALRRQATVGGNLGRAAPASDLTPVLLALDAEVELVGPSGPRTMTVDRFLRASRSTALGPAELVRSVHVPEERPVSSYLWQRVRPANDISQIGLATAYSASAGRWRISLGGIPPRPLLATDASAALSGPRPTDSQVAAASDLLASAPGLVSDRRATEEHRRRLAALLCARAVALATAGGGT